jgi:hypothetical protein
VTQSLTTYWKFHFKVLPSSMPVSQFSSSIQVFWKMCFAHWLHPFVLHGLLNHLILLDLINLLMYSEDKLRDSSSWNFILPPIISLYWVVRFYRPYTPTRLGRE